MADHEVTTPARPKFYDSDVARQYEMTAELRSEAIDQILANGARGLGRSATDFQAGQLRKNLVRNWDVFYKLHSSNFFKDRRWIAKEFDSEIQYQLKKKKLATKDASAHRLVFVDAGCGVGNGLIPLLQHYAYSEVQIDAVAFDCSCRAVGMLGERLGAICDEPPKSDEAQVSDSSGEDSSSRVKPTTPRVETSEPVSHNPDDGPRTLRIPWGHSITYDVWDITKGDVPSHLCEPGTADVLLCLFVLSAVPQELQRKVIQEIWHVLRPGGCVLFRDYGELDMAQLRFTAAKYVSRLTLPEETQSELTGRDSKQDILKCNYVRQDGTLSYFFSTEELRGMFCGDGRFEEIENEYHLREICNRKTMAAMKRVWIQAVFRKTYVCVDRKAEL